MNIFSTFHFSIRQEKMHSFQKISVIHYINVHTVQYQYGKMNQKNFTVLFAEFRISDFY